MRLGVQLEEALIVDELKDVEHEAVRVGERVPANDVHPERRQDAADIGEQERLIERGDGERPDRCLTALERHMYFVRVDVATELDVTVDRITREELQVPLRQPFEESRDFGGRQIVGPLLQQIVE